MNTIPAAKLPGHIHPIIGVRAVANDQMLWGIQLRGVHEVVCRLKPEEAVEAIRQIAEERTRLNQERFRPAPMNADEADPQGDRIREIIPGYNPTRYGYSESQRKAAESADEKPGGQAENVKDVATDPAPVKPDKI